LEEKIIRVTEKNNAAVLEKEVLLAEVKFFKGEGEKLRS
jgi:hypothetical protein